MPLYGQEQGRTSPRTEQGDHQIQRIVFRMVKCTGDAFQKTFEYDAFRSLGNILHSGEHFHFVVFERFLVDRRFVLVVGKSV